MDRSQIGYYQRAGNRQQYCSRIFLCTVALLFTVPLAVGEDGKIEHVTKPFGKVFTHWEYDFAEDASPASGFELTRSYFGAKHLVGDVAEIKITFDVGRAKELTGVSVDTNLAVTAQRNLSLEAFLKTAQLTYNNLLPGFSLTAGLHGLNQFGVQEKFWGYRYLYKSFMDEHKFGSSADLGVTATWTPAKMVKVHATVINGEGYKKLQADDNYKTALGVELAPARALTLFVYGDVMPTEDETQTTVAAFIGYTLNDIFRIGAEYNLQMAQGGATDADLTGLSLYASANVHKQASLFARYDQLISKDDWNLSSDRGTFIGGLEIAPVKGLKVSPNVQAVLPEDSNSDPYAVLFLNFEFSFK